MVNIARWKIYLSIIVCFMGFLYSAPNLLNASQQTWLQDSLPGWAPTKTINLGLDLQGGAHLLYEVDIDVVFRERTESIVQDIRSTLQQKNQIVHT